MKEFYCKVNEQPKRAEQKPPGVYEVGKMMAMAAYQEDALMKEAEASCNLDGETMDCTKCKANIRQQLIEDIEKRSQATSDELGKWRRVSESWWQQFKRGEK